MKIQGERPGERTPTVLVSPGRRVRLGEADGGSAHSAANRVTDRFDVSSDAGPLNNGVHTAHDAPEIRADFVERARARLESGKLGSDVFRLADRMIDHMLRS